MRVNILGSAPSLYSLESLSLLLWTETKCYFQQRTQMMMTLLLHQLHLHLLLNLLHLYHLHTLLLLSLSLKMKTMSQPSQNSQPLHLLLSLFTFLNLDP